MSERIHVSDTGLTCTFIPEMCATRWDEDGTEVDTIEPDEGCAYFVCSNCGGVMAYGDDGWFETEPPYMPRFSFCPHCGARVVMPRG
ncbi:hypothetical protein [Caniella muris]|uniref:hypothetical protein n=1 Tax=Caniella muris TaxID=2941502 RepID=UPI00203E6A38|nr:hypothetical protein [Caniella muris]